MMKWLGKNVGKFICKIDFDISSSKKKQKKKWFIITFGGSPKFQTFKNIGHI